MASPSQAQKDHARRARIEQVTAQRQHRSLTQDRQTCRHGFALETIGTSRPVSERCPFCRVVERPPF